MGYQGRKKELSHFRPYPDIIFLRRASNPICLCLSAGRGRFSQDNLHARAARKTKTKEKGPLRLVSATKKKENSFFEMSHDQRSRVSWKLHP